jgi:3',5'-cyclic AMP phosphodiesterase CpdA
MPRPVLIAQISDLHVKCEGELCYRRVDTAEATMRLVAALNALQPAPDLVVISGDLVDGGRAAEYDHLLRLLQPLAVPWLAVPGNHDARGPMRAAIGGFAPTPGLNRVAEVGPLRVIGLDSSVPGNAHGLLDGETLIFAEHALAAQPTQPTLLFLHHPPFATGIWHMDRQALTNASALAALAGRHSQLRLIGCGHVHRASAALFAGRPAWICPGASHAVALDLDHHLPPSFTMEQPGFLLHVYDAAADSIVTHVVPVGPSPGPFPFFDAEGRLL